MNTKQMQAALAKINPKAQAAATHEPFAQRVAVTLGALPSNAKGFLATIGTSYQYHEAVRRGDIKA